jgi:hypothetical protein
VQQHGDAKNTHRFYDLAIDALNIRGSALKELNKEELKRCSQG